MMNKIVKMWKQIVFLFSVCAISAILFASTDVMEVQAENEKPGKVVLTSVKSSDYNAIKITWEKEDNAQEYQVYRAISKNGKYKLINTTTVNSYTNTGLTTGKKYFYKVRAINETYQGTFSSIKYATPTLKKVAGLKAAINSKGNIKVSWNKVNGAKGYKVYRATSKKGTYKLVKTTTAKSYTNTGLTAGKTYYYKVRAYRVVNKSNKYGSYSDVASCKSNKLDSIRKSMLSEVNRKRRNAGLKPLQLYDPINKTAQIKAKDLYKTRVFDHYSKNLGWFYDQYEEAGILYDAGAENIAFGYPSVSDVMKGWMNSKGHKANILGDYTHLGVGYYKGYWVQQFIKNPSEEIDRPSYEKCQYCDADTSEKGEMVDYWVTFDSTGTYDGESFDNTDDCYFQQMRVTAVICKQCNKNIGICEGISYYLEFYHNLKTTLGSDEDIFDYIKWEKVVDIVPSEEEDGVYYEICEFVDTPEISDLQKLVGMDVL